MTPTGQKVVVFDLGKVLLDFDYHIAAAQLAVHARASADQIYRWLLHDEMLHRFETGLLGTGDFYRQFCAANGYAASFAAFEPCFGRIFSPLPAMIAFHQELRALGVPTWIFSNTNDIAVRYIREDFEFFRCFNGYIYSYELRSMKPAPPMYEALEERSGCRAGSVLYIDDRPENVEAGTSRGWLGIIHHDPAVTIPTVRAWLGLQPTRTH